MTIEPQNVMLIGILLLSLIAVESGGYFLTLVHRRKVRANALQLNFFRAGHAHAAVLLVLGIAILAVIDYAELEGVPALIGRLGVPIAAILMPAGFFLSVVGDDPQKPNRLIALLWIGVGFLTAGLLVSGIGLLAAGIRALG